MTLQSNKTVIKRSKLSNTPVPFLSGVYIRLATNFSPFFSEFIAFFNYLSFFEVLRLIFVYFQITKIECQVKKNEHFRHLSFSIIKGSKAAKAADFYQRGIENLAERLEKIAIDN